MTPRGNQSSYVSALLAGETTRWTPRSRALPILAGIVILAATLFGWQALIAQEHAAIQNEIQLQATNAKIAIAGDLQEVTYALVRMAERWQRQGTPSKEDWEADAALYMEHYGTFQAISWTDPSGYVRWIMPVVGNEAALNLNALSEPPRRIAMEAARSNASVWVTHTIPLKQGGKGFVIYVPIGAGQNFGGFIGGVFRIEPFFHKIFNELDERVGHKYGVAIFDGKEEIYSHYLNNRLNENKWSQETTIDFKDVTWRMRVWAEPELLTKEQYPLETLLFGGGVVMAFLLCLTIALAQERQQRIKTIAAVNQNLKREITERKRVETVLRESQSQLQEFFDNANDLIQSVLLEDGHLIYVNRAWRETLGYTEPEIERLSIFEIIHPQQLNHCMDMFQSLQAGRQELRVETIFLTKDGREIVVEGSVNCQLENGKPKATRGIFRDITERQRAENELRQAEAKYRNIYENAIEGIFQSTPDGHFISANPALVRLYGYESFEELTANLTDIRQQLYVESQRRDEFTYLLEAHGSVLGFESQIYRKDGSIIWILENARVVRNSNGEVLYYEGMIDGITERKQAEAEIRKALEKERELRELKSSFVSMVSHEFRTPLATILVAAELLEHYSDQWTQEKKLTYLRRIQSTVKQLTQLLSDVLLIGKTEAGKIEFNPAPLNLVQFCCELVEELQFGVNSNQHAINFVSECECLNACMDKKLLRHIFSNLLSNAIKYSPADGSVNFELSCQRGEAIFEIKDEGIGIPLEDQQRLFESFHRASNVGEIPGTGLGLAIVKTAVELHHGKIVVNSEVGVGTTFTVTLPLNRDR
jgi:PAS domain S-box-containing protein